MKRIFVYFILILTIIINIYLLFYWNPGKLNNDKGDYSKEVLSFTKSPYKVDKSTMLEKLSSDDKKDIEKVIKKLSAFDVETIREYFNDANEQEGIVNIFKLLKKRLLIEDYKKIEEISSKYIDIDNINKIIKKKK